MARPSSQIVQMSCQNPDATMPLFVPVLVICNTPDEDLERNITANSQRPLRWIEREPAHDRVAVLVGGGPSLAEHLDQIRAFNEQGATIFAMNGASKYLTSRNIYVDFQVIGDAKRETASLVDGGATHHLFASQVHPETITATVFPPILWHLAIDPDMDRWFPDERREAGGYSLIGGGAAVGPSALCLAEVMGYREFHCFGYDSSHRDGASHAYDQPMNQFIPCVSVEWANKTYRASVAMKAQAEKFQMVGQALKRQGRKITVHGDGLLPAMWNTKPDSRSERDKYRILWQFDSYRKFAPGEELVERFIEIAKPDSLIVDFGCGTGRAGLRLKEMGHKVFLVDFADNCRDEEAQALPFLEWDLTRPCPVSAHYGLCTDVMEHIPPKEVEKVIQNIMASARSVMFQISTRADVWGSMIGAKLHLTVQSHEWWLNMFEALGLAVQFEEKNPEDSIFFVSRDE